jgi:hypothetical protein
LSKLRGIYTALAMVLPKSEPGLDAYREKLANCPNTQTLDW